MEAEQLRCCVRVPGGIFSRQLLAGSVMAGDSGAFLEASESTMTQGLRGPSGARSSPRWC